MSVHAGDATNHVIVIIDSKLACCGGLIIHHIFLVNLPSPDMSVSSMLFFSCPHLLNQKQTHVNKTQDISKKY